MNKRQSKKIENVVGHCRKPTRTMRLGRMRKREAAYRTFFRMHRPWQIMDYLDWHPKANRSIIVLRIRHREIEKQLIANIERIRKEASAIIPMLLEKGEDNAEVH